MDHFFEINFEEEASDDNNGLFWLEPCPLPDILVHQSAFVPYSAATAAAEQGLGLVLGPTYSNGNMNKRMIELLRRRSGVATNVNGGRPERDRCFRHMINERMRRERHKESFSSLHAMLPHGTKNDKNSIMQMAAREIVVMMRYKEELRRRNKDMEATLGHKMTFKVPNNNCANNGIDSLLEVLKCLRSTGSDILNIESHFSNQQLVTQLVFQNKIAGGGDIENAVRKRLDEVEKKLQGD